MSDQSTPVINNNYLKLKIFLSTFCKKSFAGKEVNE